MDNAGHCRWTDPPGSRRLYYRLHHLWSYEKNEIKPWLVKEWCIPEADADFVAKMEDILDVYQRPYDPLNPVVCIDETNKQLIKETWIPCELGKPEKVDSVYVRNGVADVFMISEPLAGMRDTVVTQTRTALDFAEILKYTSDTLYPDDFLPVMLMWC